MGERKGQNKYYPPDYNPKVGGLNKFLGTHALRERANKIHLGILIIRFEMPYNIWCEGCKNHIGMGVRYNAEKTKIGMYYSTPVFQFRMKCHLCENYIEIKTDPGNLDYVIVSGARRQENRWDPNDNEQIVSDTKEFQRKLFDDPMFKLEHLANDQKKGNDVKPILGRLYERNDDVWRDNYVANCKLRASFRSQKKEIKRLEDIDNDLKVRSSLDIKLLPETEQDRKMANLMKLQTARTLAENEHEQILNLMNKPALPSSTITSFGGLRREKLLKTKLNKSDLGIVLPNSASTSSSLSSSSLVINGEHKKRKLDEIDSNNKKLFKEVDAINNNQTVPASDGDNNNNNNSSSVKKLINSSNSNEINSEKRISLVCNYNSSSDNDSHSDNEIINDNNNRT